MQEETKQGSWKRVLWFVLAMVVVLVVGKLLGLESYAKPSVLKGLLLSTGVWGYVLMLAIFAAGALIGLPSLLFVAVSVYTFGKLEGGALGIMGGILSVNVQFMVARWAGGKPLADTQSGMVAKILKGLDARPIITVMLLRFVVLHSPPVNYALAWSDIKLRDYAVGSAVGLTIAMTFLLATFTSFLPIA